ncbi:MAG: hypothetical protein FVQ76_11860 [Nitrospira sp.]|nr:hypothetical protein [Nitrospira sp.]
MKIGHLLPALAFVATLTLAAPAQAHETTPRNPIWWSGELELQSLDQVEQRLRRDLWPDIPEGLKLYKKQGDGHVTAQARNCESLGKLSKEDYYGGGSNNIGIQNYQLSLCRAIALLGQAKPARVSYLRDFVLNAVAVDVLPAIVNLYPSCEFICYAVAANERAIPLSTFEKILVVDVEDDDIVVWNTGWMVRLTILARGDFDADNMDDMLLLSSGGATEGSLSTANLYLVTRDEPGAVLRVIGAERERCPDRGCPSPSLFFYEHLGLIAVHEEEGVGGPIVSERSDAGAADAGPPYPVWWLQNRWFLWLESLDQIDALRMDKGSFHDGQGIPLYSRKDGDLIKTRAYSCDALEKLTREGYFGGGDQYPWEQHDDLAYCRALALLKRVKPAKTSHLRAFRLNSNALDYLPAAVILPVTCDRICRAHEADQSGIPLSRFEKIRRVQWMGEDEAVVWTEDRKVFLTIIARGDFTSDGIDDLLLMAQGGLVDWPEGADRLFLLTREEPDAMLRVVMATPGLCPGYECSASDTDLETAVAWDSAPETVDLPYPVWWTPSFDLKALDQVELRRRGKIRPGSDLGIRLYKGQGDDEIEIEARSCVDLEGRTRAGFGATDGSLGYRQLYYLAECRAIELLGAVQPARTRHIGDAVLGEKNVHELLVALGFLRRHDMAHGTSVPGTELVLAGGLGRLLAIDIRSSDAADVWAEAGRVRLSVQARGDFTADGVEDVLIFAGLSRSRYRPKLTHLCAITRDAPDAPLRLIEVATYSCRELRAYGKPAGSDDPS